MGESFAVEGKQTYLRLNFRSGLQYGGAHSNSRACKKNDVLSISGRAHDDYDAYIH